MEAIVAAPAPAPTPQVKNVKTEQGGSDSTFAPTLAQALSEKKTSGHDQSTADRQQTEASEGNRQDSSADTVEEQSSAAGMTNTVEEQSSAAGMTLLQEEQRRTAADSKAYLKNDGSAVQPQTVGGKGGEDILAGSRSTLFPLPAQATFTGSADTATIATALKDGAPAEAGTFSIDVTQARAAGERLRAAAFSSPAAMPASMQPSTPQSSTLTLQGGANPLEMMQQNETISWSRLPSNNQRDFFQKPLSIVLTEGGMVTSQPQTPVSTEKLLAELSQISADGNGPVTLRNGDQISLRHTISGQFLQAKTETAGADGEQKGAQQFLDGESNPARQALTAATGKPVDSSFESSFSQSLSQAGGDKIPQPAADPMRPGALPFTTAVTDNEILQQVVNKFRISQHMQDSKITMKLHPAELGNLKIDIQLKGGTINANIVAQTQQVQEILEKNMPRLKALMEQQGLKVEDIIIKLDSELPAEHNLFDEQLSQQGSSSQGNTGQSHSVFSMDPGLEQEDVAEHTQDPGVNVTI